MELKFSSIEEVQEFVKRLKGTRGGKDKDDGEGQPATGSAPAPIQPPPLPPAATAGFNPGAGFAALGAGAAPSGGEFPAVGAPAMAPEIAGLVDRIGKRADFAIQSGQPADQCLGWFRSQCGPEAANYTMDQIKTMALPKMSMAQLEGIAKLMNA